MGAGPGRALFEPVDLVVLKVKVSGKEVPVIPGSSWKGLFRSTATSLARSAGLAVCDGVPGSTCLRGDEFYELERGGGSVEEKASTIVDAKVKVCLNCLIFGSPSIHSHVMFSDSFVEGEYSLGYRTCVAIDRRTGAAYRGALFTVEYVEPGCMFNFELRAENLPNYALGLLAFIIDLIGLGIVRVGGLKSRGFGKVHFEDLRIAVYSPLHELYGVDDGQLKPLDPIDSPVAWTGSTGRVASAEGNEARNVLGKLREAWDRSLESLKKVSREGWRWSVVC